LIGITGMDIEDKLLNDAIKIEDEIIEIRRKIHMEPEIAYQERKTSSLVAEKLRTLGIEVKENVGGTGVLGIIRGKGNGKVVALRADMDALPVEEKTDLPFSSRIRGVMHACGHDTHVAMLLGAAFLIKKNIQYLEGEVKLLFQPAEEHGGRGGAKPMIEDGVMENPKVNYVFGLHITSRLPSFTFGLRAGAMMAAPDQFTIKIVGQGGHGSEPHKTIDPIYIMSHLILSLQAVSARMIDPVEPFVISVGKVSSGTKSNVIPDEALIEGTLRTLTKETRERSKSLIKRISESVCETFGASCYVEFQDDAYPVLYNNPEVTGEVSKVLARIPGTKVVEVEPVLGGEDFSRFLELAPGAFYFLGTYNENKGCIYPNHSSRFKVDEDVLKFGAVSLALLGMEFSRK
jgi:carboxypeptidase Ss1